MMRLNFDAIRDLHNNANDLLRSPITEQCLTCSAEGKWVQEVSEASLRMLDACGTSKDVLFLVKEHLQHLQSLLRKVAIRETNLKTKIAEHSLYRKKLKKEKLKCLKTVKGMKNKSTKLHQLPQGHNLVLVVNALGEVRIAIISVVESLLSLVSLSMLDPKYIKGLSGSKLWSDGGIQTANKRLMAVAIAIEDLEIELEGMFRRLIQTRVSLLNILTN